MKPKHIEFDGKVYTGPELARVVGIVPWTVAYMRLQRDWSVFDAFHTPLTVWAEDRDTRPKATHQEAIDRHRKLAAWHTERANLHQRKLQAERAKDPI